MKKLSLGVSLIFIDLVLIVAGITCLIIGSIASEQVISSLIEFLLVFGWVGVGVGVGSILTFFGILLIASYFG